MSQSKRMLEDEWARRDKAIDIAVRAGALQRCELHEDDTYLGPKHDADNVYRLANSEYSQGKHTEVYGSRTEMTDSIKAVLDEHFARECPSCAKALGDD